MSEQSSIPGTCVLLSFSSSYAESARRVASDLRGANIEVRLDQWDGGGGLPAAAGVVQPLDDVSFVLPLLTPSDVAATWVGREWRKAIFEPAGKKGIAVLPVRGEGDLGVVPDFLNTRSFADLHQDYPYEFRRLVKTIRDRSGDEAITVPDDQDALDVTDRPPTALEDPISLVIGRALAPLFDETERQDRFHSELLPMMRDGLYFELGVEFPGVSIFVDDAIPSSSAKVTIHGVPDIEVDIHSDAIVVNESAETMEGWGFTARPAENPATRAPFAWIPAEKAPEASARGLAAWDPLEFIIFVLSAVLRRRAAAFVGIEEAEAKLRQIETYFPRLVEESVPKTVSLFVFTDVLRRLVAEDVSTRNLRQILLALAEWGRIEQDPHRLTEHVRAALRRQLTHQLSRGTNQLTVLLLDPSIESSIRAATRHTAVGSYLDLPATDLHDILEAIRKPVSALPRGVQVPQILTTLEVRAAVRRMVATSLPLLYVTSYPELRPDAAIQPIGRISLDGFQARPGVTVGGLPLWGNMDSERKWAQ